MHGTISEVMNWMDYSKLPIGREEGNLVSSGSQRESVFTATRKVLEDWKLRGENTEKDLDVVLVIVETNLDVFRSKDFVVGVDQPN